MTKKLIARENPPVCFHILGQGLANRLWAEGKEVRDAALKLLLTIPIVELNKFNAEQQEALLELREAVEP